MATGGRVIITGAASGIGAAAALELRSRGARVVGLDVRAGGDIIACDVRDQAAVDAAVGEAIEHLDGLDVVINNAGIGTPQSAGARPDEGALAVLDVNLLGPWRVTAAALPALIESGGRVINVASGLAFMTVPFAAAYCMSKRGLVAYSDALRIEYGNAVTVTTVYPGYIRTAIHEESAGQGIGLEGMVPSESLQDAARALARAALGPPVRDLATTRRGAVSYAALTRLPRRLVDRGIRMHIRRRLAGGAWRESELGAAFAERVASGRKR